MTGKTVWIGAVLLLAALCFVLRQNSGLRADITILEKKHSEAIAANAAQKSAIDELVAQTSRHSEQVVTAEREISAMTARAKNLEYRLQKATRDAKYSSFQFGRDVSNALCLRWLGAEGRLPGARPTDSAGSLLDGRDDPVAAFCAAWNDLTAEDAAVYIGDLIDHAGRVNRRLSAARSKE